MKNLKTITTWISFLLIISCSNEKKEINIQTINYDSLNNKTANNQFISPPIKEISIPFENCIINTKTGGNIVFKTGSSIYFPPNAFIDKNGEVIKGDVNIAYREFSDPFDFFIAGIPMNYDTLNSSYTFESAGMCEINAQKDNDVVFVNPQNKPIISLYSRDNDPSHNLYYLDTIQKRWIVKGKSKIKNTSKIKENTKKPLYHPIAENNITLPPEPIKPNKANNEKPSFSVNIPYVDFVPELKIFKNTKFEIDDSEKNYDPNEANYEWDNVSLKETNIKGIYLIVFSTLKRKISYRVRPVYEGVDYAEAMEIFTEQQKQYEIEKLKLIEQQKIEEEYRTK